MSYPPPNTFDPFDPHGHEQAYEDRMHLLRNRATSSYASGGTSRQRIHDVPPTRRSSRYTGKTSRTMPAVKNKKLSKGRRPYRRTNPSPRTVVGFVGGNFPRTIQTTLKTHLRSRLVTPGTGVDLWTNTRLNLSNIENPWASTTDPGYDATDGPRALDKFAAIWDQWFVEKVKVKVTFTAADPAGKLNVFILPSKEETTLTPTNGTAATVPYGTINDIMETPRVKHAVLTGGGTSAATRTLIAYVTPSDLYGHKVGIDNDSFISRPSSPASNEMFCSVGCGNGIVLTTGATSQISCLLDITIESTVRFFDRQFDI